MKQKREKNVQAFNADIKKRGTYEYTNFERYSAYIATKRQTDEIGLYVKKFAGKAPTILDVGCGDGILTIDLYQLAKPKKIIGFDKSSSAIKTAQRSVPHKDRNLITFQVGDVYKVHKMFKGNSFDIIVIRGVLHHLYRPEEAIKSLSGLSKKIVVLEPNGYNPFLKVIEKVSPYHRKHEERSYYPPAINKWFLKNDFKTQKQSFFCTVPYFCPDFVARFLKSLEPFVERLPVLPLFLCGANIIYYEKNS